MISGRAQSKFELLILSLICALPFYRSIRFVTYLSLEDILVIIIFIWIVLTKYAFYRRYLVQFFFAFFITFILVVQTLLVSVDSYGSVVNIMKCVNTYVFLPLVIKYLTREINSRKYAILSYTGSACVSSIISLLGTSPGIISPGRVSGYAGDPVMYSILLSFAVCILLSNFPIILSISVILRFLLLSLLILEILRTGSGSGLAIILIAVIAQRIMPRKANASRESVLIYFGTLMLFAMFWNSAFASKTRDRISLILNPRASYATQAGTGQSTIESRLLSIKYAMDQIRESPILGHGFSFDSQLTVLGLQPHNYFILAWLTGGAIFLICTLLLSLQFSKVALLSYFRGDTLTFTILLGAFSALMTEPFLWDTGFFTPLLMVSLNTSVSQVEKK
jgi:hypothetical protein